VILAAGSGTRMRSELPKPLHAVAGLPMIDHVIKTATELGSHDITVVVSAQVDRLLADRDRNPRFRVIVQDPPRGTGDAVRLALARPGGAAITLVLYADHPLVTSSELIRLIETARCQSALVALLTTKVDVAAGYGRIARNEAGMPVAVVEMVDDEPESRAGSTEINSGIMALDTSWARSALERLRLHPLKGEYFLTDLIGLAVSSVEERDRWPVASINGPREILAGINDRIQLDEADRLMRNRIRKELQDQGVTLVGSETIFIDAGVVIEPDTTILPFTVIGSGTRIGRASVIGPSATIKASRIGSGVKIESSTIEDSIVFDGADVGPYAHVRNGSKVGQSVHVGNFAELKNATLGEGVRVGHFSYLGDASVGSNSNIGAGTVTCNFDGVDKHRTEIGSDAFIGSDSMLIAPIKIGDGARTGAGAVVTKDVAAGDTVVGMPARSIRIRRAE
jgi:bifunctional UDP-N-acetylglucosamine pyrophosphorylase / glucosamine-1-phosphate N-acetyltransferase